METLAHARQEGVTIELRCQRPSRVGTAKLKPCRHFYRLDLETLIATRGHKFPVSMLQSRLLCPKCGDRNVLILFHGGRPATRAAVS